jgi:hypothetical protein
MKSNTEINLMLTHLHTKYLQQVKHSRSLKLKKIEPANFFPLKCH